MTARWRRVSIVCATGVALASAFQFCEKWIPFAGSFVWPGMGAALITMLPFHTSFWDHPNIFSGLALFYNALLYSLLIWGAMALARVARR